MQFNIVQKNKTYKKALVSVTIIISGILLTTVIILLILSPGQVKPYVDINGIPLSGSTAEKIFLPIGGVKQGMFIKSKNMNNPVLLYVHGGPAFPNYFLIDKFQPGLEDHLTVCYWEQRGGGLSYSSEVPLESMNFDQLASDAVEVSNYLLKRFGKEKIYIMAHSGGTPIALLAVARNPELYYAYVAMAQITKQKVSEKIAYEYMLAQYTLAENHRRIKELTKYKVLESDLNIKSFYKSKVRDQFMHELGIGTMHTMKSIFLDIFLPVWTCPAYTLGEKVNIWRSKFSFLPKTNLIDELLEFDFTTKVPKVDIPIYFFSGQYDLTVNKELSKAYLTELQAPLKGFYTFENSAHSPLFEEPAKVMRIFEEDILKGANSLADRK